MISHTCGTYFGDTKDVASMVVRPQSLSLFISSIFTFVGMICFSFCKPSRAPTSTIFTWEGILESLGKLLNGSEAIDDEYSLVVHLC